MHVTTLYGWVHVKRHLLSVPSERLDSEGVTLCPISISLGACRHAACCACGHVPESTLPRCRRPLQPSKSVTRSRYAPSQMGPGGEGVAPFSQDMSRSHPVRGRPCPPCLPFLPSVCIALCVCVFSFFYVSPLFSASLSLSLLSSTLLCILSPSLLPLLRAPLHPVSLLPLLHAPLHPVSLPPPSPPRSSASRLPK